VRRALSVLALVALDIAGLALGIYLALVVRELVLGDGDVLWGLLWNEGPAEWLKFAAPITVLVFAQAGLYGHRERRPGAGRILASLIVVALIVLAFGLGTGYDFTTSGLIPTAVLVSALTIGLLRASYESVSLEVMRAAGVRRRVLLVGEGRSLIDLRNTLAAARGGLDYEFVGVVSQAV
jgi:FlaA1/EpsC-like NDP-sugar epimerase